MHKIAKHTTGELDKCTVFGKIAGSILKGDIAIVVGVLTTGRVIICAKKKRKMLLRIKLKKSTINIFNKVHKSKKV